MAAKPGDAVIRLALKPAVFALALAPLAWIVWRATQGQLGANPVETITRFLGDWALRFLLVSLALTPLKEITGWAGWIRFRRMMGLFAFFYVVMHVLDYVVLDHYFDWGVIWKDIVKRTYITIGMAGLLTLIPLAVTSTKGWVKRLGGRRWQRLHRLVYAAGVAGVFHFAMMVKADLREPLIYAAVLALLFAVRIAAAWRRRAARAAARPQPA